jgi:hypothetical protein
MPSCCSVIDPMMTRPMWRRAQAADAIVPTAAPGGPSVSAASRASASVSARSRRATLERRAQVGERVAGAELPARLVEVEADDREERRDAAAPSSTTSMGSSPGCRSPGDEVPHASAPNPADQPR